MLLNKISEGIASVKNGDQFGLETICNNFLGAVLPSSHMDGICSVAGGIDMKLRGLMDNLLIDEFSSVVDSFRNKSL